MDLALQKAILSADLMPTEKLVGLCIAFYINPRAKKAFRHKQAKIASACGISERTVRRAIKALIDAGFIQSETCGRSCAFKSIFNIDRSPVSYQIGHPCPHSFRNPMELDTEFSTKAEEINKRLDAAFKKEQRNGRRTQNAG